MYKYYWYRMLRLGSPSIDVLFEEVQELLAEKLLSRKWIAEFGDVAHTLLRLVHPRLGILVWGVCAKHAVREMYAEDHKYYSQSFR